MIKKEEWLIMRNLKNQGLTISEISRQLNVDRKTVYNNIKKDHLPKYERKKENISKLDSYKDYIRSRLEKRNLTAVVIKKEIDKQGYMGCYSILADFVSSLKGNFRNKAVLRFETMPGEQAQVDWGYMGEIYDTELGRTVKVNCFVMILGYSRMRFVKFYTDTKLDNFLDGHNSAFGYFGGYTREILYDNLKSVVIKRALRAEDSEFNKRFMDFSGYYGFNPILCRPYKPCTKGKVEKTVDFAKRNFYAGEKFSSISEMNKKALEWLDAINSTVHATTHECPSDRLKSENLISIKHRTLYNLTPIFYRKVHIDCHFSYEGNMYSVPYEYAGKEISVIKNTEDTIQIKYHTKVVAEHVINKQQKHTYITLEKHFEGLKSTRIKPMRIEQDSSDLATFSTDTGHNNDLQINLGKYDEVIL